MKRSEKLDLYKQYKSEYATPRDPLIIETKPAVYLAINGKGDPNGDEFARRMSALYGVAFTTKMTKKKEEGTDYVVCKLEGLWWSESAVGWNFLEVPRDQWKYKILIRTPEFIAESDLEAARIALAKKGKGELTDEVRLEVIDEGLVVQALHVGPYADETPLIRRMHEAAGDQGLEFHGRHHEIYLSDPRRTAAEKLRTILRHPVRPSKAV